MPEIPPSEVPCNCPEQHGGARAHKGRPPDCKRCAASTWWNGWRLVFPVVEETEGALRRVECWLEKAKCSACHRGCCIYPPGHYPRRQYQLDPVAKVVAADAMGETKTVQRQPGLAPSRSSRRRWRRWMAELCDPARLWAMAVRLDPDTVLSSSPPLSEPKESVRARAWQVLCALEGLGEALYRLGQGLGYGSGLGRVLGWQYTAHGDVYSPTVEPKSFSPAMAV